MNAKGRNLNTAGSSPSSSTSSFGELKNNDKRTSSSPTTTTSATPPKVQEPLRKHFASNNALFPWKLFELLDDCENTGNDGIISWMPDGRTFKVHDTAAFVEEIMPQYFRQTKYRSFQRQLNFWGFQRVTSAGKEKGSYFHPHFIKGQPALCQQLSRNPNDLATTPSRNDSGVSSTTSSQIEPTQRKATRSHLKEQQEEKACTIKSTSGSSSPKSSKLLSSRTSDLLLPECPSSNPIHNNLGGCTTTTTASSTGGLHNIHAALEGLFDPTEDKMLLGFLLKDHCNDLLTLPASQLCNVFSSSDEESPSMSSQDDSSFENIVTNTLGRISNRGDAGRSLPSRCTNSGVMSNNPNDSFEDYTFDPFSDDDSS